MSLSIFIKKFLEITKHRSVSLTFMYVQILLIGFVQMAFWIVPNLINSDTRISALHFIISNTANKNFTVLGFALFLALGLLFTLRYMIKIGDLKGRVPVFVTTSFLSAFSCLILACMPIVQKIAPQVIEPLSFFIIALQSLSTFGSILAMELYISESVKEKLKATAVSFVAVVFCASGVLVYLTLFILAPAWIMDQYCLSSFFLSIGLAIALIGLHFIARLKESGDFTKHLTQDIPKSDIASTLALLVLQSAWTTSPMFVWGICSDILKSSFLYTQHQIVQHNLKAAVIITVMFIVLAFVSRYFNPMGILKIKSYLLALLFLSLTYVLNNLKSPLHVLLIQISTIALCSVVPAGWYIYSRFQILKRFGIFGIVGFIAPGISIFCISFSKKQTWLLSSNWIFAIQVFFIAIFLIALRHLDKRKNASE